MHVTVALIYRKFNFIGAEPLKCKARDKKMFELEKFSS